MLMKQIIPCLDTISKKLENGIANNKKPHGCVKNKVQNSMSSTTQLPLFFSSFPVPDPKFRDFFQIWWFDWIQLMILDRMKSYLWKLELGFWPYSLTNALCPSGSYLVFRPKTPRPMYFLRFNHLIEFTLWF